MYKILSLVNGAFFRDEKGHVFYFTNEEQKNPAHEKLRIAQALEPEAGKVILMGIADLQLSNAVDLVDASAATVPGKGGLTPAQKSANTRAAKKGLPLPFPVPAEETK